MNERIKIARRYVGLTQEDFAEALGFSKGYISQIEVGTRIPPDRTLEDISRKFNISFEWLKNGTGEIVKKIPKDQLLASFFGDVLSADQDNATQMFQKRLITALANLSVEEWEKLRQFAEEITSPSNEEQTDK